MRFLSCFARFRHPLVSIYIAFLLMILIAIEPGFAQSPPATRKPQPQPSLPPLAVDQEQFVPYWTTETGWATEIQLRNNLANAPLVVTPALRTADGAETTLAPVTLQPHEVQSIDLTSAIGTGNPQLVTTYGSAVLRYHSGGLRNLYAAVMLRTIGHPIAFHVDATGEIQNYESASREGIWWLPNDAASDYLVLNNEGPSSMQLDLTVFDAAGKAFPQKIVLGPRQVTRLSVRKLVQLGGLKGTYGGIRISASAHAGSLDSMHLVFDPQSGFSALLKMFDHDPNATMSERDHAKTGVWTLRAPMLALSQPDPALLFPDGTTLQPQLFLRNTTSKTLKASLRFLWRSDSQTAKSQGPLLQLNPYETRRVDVAALQDGAILPKDAHWATVILSTNGQPDEAMAVATSYDASLQHGAQTPFSDQLAFAWEGGMWEYDALHDSIITAGNGGTKPATAVLTLFYNRGSERYDLEQTLQPDEQMWIDVGKLIRENVPDKNGKTLPRDLTMGSYEFRDLNNNLAGSLFEGKVITEKIYGHATYGCMNCCDYYYPQLTFDPLVLPVPGSAPNGVGAEDCNGNQVNVSSSFHGNWTTRNTSIATVNFYGTHTGVAVGSTISDTFGPLMTQHGRICYNTDQSASGGDNAMTLSCPSSVTRGSSATCTVNNAPSGTTFSAWKFVDSSNNTVNGTNTGGSWAGTIVTSGTVSVTATGSGGQNTPLTAAITVTNRSGFALNALTTTLEPSSFSINGCSLAIPSPPQAGQELGASCAGILYSYKTSQITDNGPNQGYQYVTSVSYASSAGYYYALVPDILDPNSAFSQAQCGNYNATTNPNGFISQSNLENNITRHEAGPLNSHYAQYVTAQNNSANNIGAVGEQIVSPASDTNFSGTVKNALDAKVAAIGSAMESPEPCGAEYNGSGQACVFQGNINFMPYTACH